MMDQQQRMALTISAPTAPLPVQMNNQSFQNKNTQKRLQKRPQDTAAKARDSKPLPLSAGADADDNDDGFVHEFARSDVRELIHCITQELKLKASKTPLVLLAFRPKISDAKLTEFLALVIPNGDTPAKLSVVERVVQSTDEYTLVTALKYLWARLPMNAIIGWDAYESFKKLEERDNYSKKAFLEHMPQCLSSPSHASIVYDFLDLIVAFASNSKENQLSGRKIAKMTGIWAFHGVRDSHTNRTNTSTFADGLREWIPAADAMFHLLLAFLRAMLPEDVSTKLQLPRMLQALLASNSYPPPPDMTYNSTTMVTVPLITIRSNVLSNSPIELINKIPKVLKFDNADQYQVKEDYALLKSLCKSDENILNKLSSESRRIVQALCRTSSDSNLKPNWPEFRSAPNTKELPPDVQISRVSIDDFFIWTWLASISFEQTSTKKKIFGRSLITEVVFDGFKKWLIVEEVNTTTKLIMPTTSEKPKVKKTHQPHYRSMLDDLPPSPEKKNKKLGKKPKAEDKPGPRPLPKPLPKPLPQIQIKTQTPAAAQQRHVTPIVPDPRAVSGYNPMPTVEQLPEIETNQYRLSIPLDGFGLNLDFDQDQFQEPQDQYLHQDTQYQYQDRHYEDQQYDQQQFDEQYDTHQPQSYKYWSSEKEVPEQHNPEHTMAVTQPYVDRNYPGGSLENLTSMVDEMSLKVNQVGSKLGMLHMTAYDAHVPLPNESPHPFNQPDEPVRHVRKDPSPESQNENVPPSETGSSVYGPVPTEEGYESQSREHATYLSDSQSTNVQLGYEKQRTSTKQEAKRGYRVRSMVDEAFYEAHTPRASHELQPSQKKSVDADHDQDYSAIEPRESYQSTSTLERGSSHVDVDDGYVDDGSQETSQEDKRISAHSAGTGKYPDSILDGYDYVTSENSPAKSSRPVSMQRIPQSLSTKDMSYIPESSLPDVPLPVPSLPRSPAANKRFSAEPKMIAYDEDTPKIVPVPVLAPESNNDSPLSAADSFHTSRTRQTVGESVSSVPTPRTAEKYELKPLPTIEREHNSSHETSRDQLRESETPAAPRQPSPQKNAPQRKPPSRSPERSEVPRKSVSPQGQRPMTGNVSGSGLLNAPEDRGSDGSMGQGQAQGQGQYPRTTSPGQQAGYIPQERPQSNNSMEQPRNPSPLRQGSAQQPGPQWQHPQGGYPLQSPRPPQGQYLQPGGYQLAPYQQSPGQYPPPQGSYQAPQRQYQMGGYQQYPSQEPDRSSNGSASSLPGQKLQSPLHTRGNTPQPQPRHDSLGSGPYEANSPRRPSQAPRGFYPTASPPPAQGGYPPQAYVTPPQQQVYYPPQQGYPQGYPQGGYYPPQPHGFYLPPQGYGYAIPPPQQQHHRQKPTGSDMVMQSMAPTAAAGNKLHYKGKNTKGVHAALRQGDFGI